MRHAAGQLPDCLHLLRLPQGLLGARELGLRVQAGRDVLGVVERADDAAVLAAQGRVRHLPARLGPVGVAELLGDGEDLAGQGPGHQRPHDRSLVRGEQVGEHLADLHPVREDAEELVAVRLVEGDQAIVGVEGADRRGARLDDVAREPELGGPLRDLPLQVLVLGSQRPGAGTAVALGSVALGDVAGDGDELRLTALLGDERGVAHLPPARLALGGRAIALDPDRLARGGPAGRVARLGLLLRGPERGVFQPEDIPGGFELVQLHAAGAHEFDDAADREHLHAVRARGQDAPDEALATPEGVAAREPAMGVEVEPDQVGERPEHADDAGVAHARRLRVDGAEGAEDAAVRKADRHGDVALEPVRRRGRMAAEDRVLGDVVDHDLRAAAPDLVADGRRQRQLAAGLQPEADVVPHAAGDPAVVRHAGDGGEAHAGCAADHVEDGRDRRDALDREHVCLDLGREGRPGDVAVHRASPLSVDEVLRDRGALWSRSISRRRPALTTSLAFA